jgi:hypothetical protein
MMKMVACQAALSQHVPMKTLIRSRDFCDFCQILMKDFYSRNLYARIVSLTQECALAHSNPDIFGLKN